jgi:hypothetical protein
MNEPKLTAPKLTAYGLPERKEPLTTGYVMTAAKPGEPGRDPTNGRLYVKAADGSLRRAQLTQDAEGHSALMTKPREQRVKRREQRAKRRGRRR